MYDRNTGEFPLYESKEACEEVKAEIVASIINQPGIQAYKAACEPKPEE